MRDGANREFTSQREPFVDFFGSVASSAKIALPGFFFKQKTAYEMLRSLVGSEMCIRDRFCSKFWKIVNTQIPTRSIRELPDSTLRVYFIRTKMRNF